MILVSQPVVGQEDDNDYDYYYRKRVEQYKSFWDSLIPRYTKVQFAGSMGMFSFGFGWNYGRNHWETDMFFGFVPKDKNGYSNVSHYKTQKALLTYTVKQNYIPWNIRLTDDISIEPLTCGLYLNTLLNRDFWIRSPDKYPSGYYFFSTKIRPNIFVGERITFNLNTKHRRDKSITFFYEISTNDLYLICAFSDHLKPRDYLGLSLGVKVQIF